jgi:integrase
MLALARRVGLRRGEISRVHRERDVSWDGRGWTLVVHGKGGRLRRLPLPDDLAGEIREGSGWLFPGRIDGHLSAQYVGKLMATALEQEWTAHTLRHGFATSMYRSTGDLLVVQKFLGHARPETTAGYVLVMDSRLRDALDRVPVPS